MSTQTEKNIDALVVGAGYVLVADESTISSLIDTTDSVASIN
jgi:hypothetical protein